MGRTRATSREWLQYYERADRARARFGDPFQKLVQRRAQRDRLLRLGAIVLGMAVTIALAFSIIWVLENVSLDSIVGASLSE